MIDAEDPTWEQLDRLTWDQVDRDLGYLAHALGADQSPREAQLNAELDELTRGPFPEIPTEAEALAALGES